MASPDLEESPLVYTLWKCKSCGCLWRFYEPWGIFPFGSYSLEKDQIPGKCCDNVAMNLEHVECLYDP